VSKTRLNLLLNSSLLDHQAPLQAGTRSNRIPRREWQTKDNRLSLPSFLGPRAALPAVLSPQQVAVAAVVEQAAVAAALVAPTA
jgi:hypothetical protein